MDPLTRLVQIIMAAGIALYIGAVALAVALSWATPTAPTLPDWFDWAVVGIGGAFATIFGATLGVKIKTLGGGAPDFSPPPAMSAQGTQLWPWHVIVTYAYALALGIALIGVIVDALISRSPNTAPVLFTMAQTAIGAIVGVVLVYARPPGT